MNIVDQSWKILKTVSLDESVFSDANINNDLMYDFVRMQQANARVVIASTKNRGEVKASRKKMYKQKGNGVGRAGDRTTPLRRKWGIAFGPRPERNFSLDMPKKMRKAALRSALSVKAAEDIFVGLDSFDTSKISTKNAAMVLKNIQADRSVLVVTNNNVDVMKCYRNLAHVDIVDASYISVFDVLKAKKVVFVGDALDQVIAIVKKK